ncbi:MAG: hypothetical protein GY906_10150 [bacterium]|nr:hypothetical protein [bacterium]
MAEIQAGLDRVLEKASSRIRASVQSRDGARFVAGISPLDVPRVLRDGLELPETDPIFATSIKPGDFRGIVRRILARVKRTQESAADVLRNLTGIGLTPEERELLEVDRLLGGNQLMAELIAAAEAALFKPTGVELETRRGESVDTRIPTQKIRDALASMGGAAAEAATRNLLAGQGAGIVANGERITQLAARRGVRTLVFTWVYGNPAARQSNFEPHMNINGVQWDFEDPDPDVLATAGTGAEWIGQFFRPGDHKGCMCVASRTVVVRPAGAGTQTEPPFDMPDPPSVCPDHRGLTAAAHILVATAACRTSIPGRRVESQGIELGVVGNEPKGEGWEDFQDAFRNSEWEEALTPGQMTGLEEYVLGDAYTEINQVLRTDPDLILGALPDDPGLVAAFEELVGTRRKVQPSDFAEWTVDLNEAMDKTRFANSERTVYRSIKRSRAEDWLGNVGDGSTVMMDGFTSTTIDPASLIYVEEQLPQLLKTDIPVVLEMKVTSGAYVGRLGDLVETNEGEWLMPHQTGFRIDSVEDAVTFEADGVEIVRTVITMTEVNPW